jgi:malonate-semialdehyde dehydrogenase (acetylating)/methylmalonate-semialdehyde dehydrogenase
MPNAPIYATRSPIESSFFGNAGQRCLAGSNLIPVGKETPHNLLRKFVQKARQMCVGYGLEPTTEIGPVITEKAKNRILGNIKGGTQNKQSYFWMEGIRMSLDIQTVSTWDQRFSITYPEI